MATNWGTKQILDGLVFGYDTGYPVSNNDTGTRFYPGQQTINLLYQAGASNLTTGANDIYGYCTKTDLGNGKYKFVNNGTASSAIRMYVASPSSLTNGAYYACSIYFEGLKNGTLSMDWADTSVTGNSSASSSTNTSGRLGGYGVRASYASPFYFLDINLSPNAEVIIYNPQVELGSYVTPFVAGTRYGSTSLIDLKRTTTIDVTNISYNSNVNPYFDGTNDYISTNATGIVPNYLSPYTVSVWYRRNRNNAGYEEMLSQWTSAQSGNSFYLGFNNSSVRFTDSWQTVSVAGAGNINEWINLVGVYTVSNAYIYLNGTLAATKGSGFSYTGTGTFLIGKQGELNSEYFQGDIPVVSIYNRALSSTEVQQNFNAYRKRFNI